MSIEDNKMLVTRYIEMWNTGDVHIADAIIAGEYIDHLHPGMPPGPELIKTEISEFRAVISDGYFTIEQMISEGEIVAFRGRMHAMFRSDVRDIPATGRHVTLTNAGFVFIVGGKLHEYWPTQDTLAWAVQLGASISFPQQGKAR